MSDLLKSLRRKYFVNSSRYHLEEIIKRAAGSVPDGSLVLDAGAGNGLYAPFFRQARYESADFGQVDKEYAHCTYVCDLKSIPVEENRYDLVLLTQVLEHLPDPIAVLRELNRVLKPGCKLWLTQPFYYEEHEQPYDFYRYTQFGLKHLLAESGFRTEKISWLEGYLGTVAYQFDYASRNLPISRHAYGGGWAGAGAALGMKLIKPSLLVLALCFSKLDQRHKHVSSGHCKNYSVIAVKPEEGSGR